MNGGFHVDTGVLRQIASDLESAGTRAGQASRDLTARPDAGQSSHEVVGSITSLTGAIAALGEALGASASDLHATATDYDRTDSGVSESMHGLHRQGPR